MDADDADCDRPPQETSMAAHTYSGKIRARNCGYIFTATGSLARSGKEAGKESEYILRLCFSL